MGRCIALIASHLCRYFCFESISSERICICTELICICTETADQEGISRVGAATDLFGADSKAAPRSFSNYVLFQCVFFLGRILSLKTAIALNAPQITAIGFCQEVNNWPFFAKLWGEGSHIWSQLLQVKMYIISYFISYCCRLAFYWVENRARLRLTYLAGVQKLLRSQSIFEQTTHL